MSGLLLDLIFSIKTKLQGLTVGQISYVVIA